MKRPSFQFYPADWRANAKLRRCSPAARGVWLDIMCLLHDSDEYGLVRWTLKEIARAVGASASHVRELVEKDVLKGSDKQITEPFIYTPRSGRKDGEPVTLIAPQPGPLWYSSRMVKDEYVRTVRGQSSRFGDGEGDAPEPSPKPPKGDGSSSSSSSSSSTKPHGSDSRGGEGAGRGYAFEGRVIRLTQRDFDRWKAAYSAIPDLRAELSSLDDWLAGQPEDKRKRWFHTTSGALSRKHQERLDQRQQAEAAKPAPRPRLQYDEAVKALPL